MTALARAILAGWSLLLVPPPGVEAHAALVSAAPARRATLSQAPPRVELVFSERLEPAYARASVWDARGRQVDRQDATVVGADGRTLRVSLPPLGPGRYTVRYRVLSVDGHVVEDAYVFTIRGQAARRAR